MTGIPTPPIHPGWEPRLAEAARIHAAREADRAAQASTDTSDADTHS